MRTRIAIAGPRDAPDIACIYNHGIASRRATFETRPRAAVEIDAWLASGAIVVCARDDTAVTGFAASFPYRARDCYRGIGEFSVYVDPPHQGRGIGTNLLHALIAECESAGLWKLLSRVFPENVACRALLKSVGFREVGVYEYHAQLDGVWRDVVIVERLLISRPPGTIRET